MNQTEFLDFLSRAADTSRQDCFENYKEKEIAHLLKTSDESTRQCFYQSTPADTHGFSTDIINDFAELAIKLKCYNKVVTGVANKI